MIHRTTKSEKELEIAMKKGLDPMYIEKSKKSICKGCVNNLGFNGEFYDCKVYKEVLIDYRREGIFHTEIIKCTEFIASRQRKILNKYLPPVQIEKKPGTKKNE